MYTYASIYTSSREKERESHMMNNFSLLKINNKTKFKGIMNFKVFNDLINNRISLF